jgi:hypothetical protein
MLSGEARVDTKPQLEIYRPTTLKVAHGAPWGQDRLQEELYYLETRGTCVPELGRHPPDLRIRLKMYSKDQDRIDSDPSSEHKLYWTTAHVSGDLIVSKAVHAKAQGAKEEFAKKTFAFFAPLRAILIGVLDCEYRNTINTGAGCLQTPWDVERIRADFPRPATDSQRQAAHLSRQFRFFASPASRHRSRQRSISNRSIRTSSRRPLSEPESDRPLTKARAKK